MNEKDFFNQFAYDKENKKNFINIDGSINYENIYKIDCSLEEDITELPKLQKLINLEHLDCSDCKIKELILEYLPNLKYVNASSNEINFYFINQTYNIETFDISNNQISNLAREYRTITSDIYLFKNLKYLDLSNNRLLTFLNLDNSNLEYLDISYNRISQEELYLNLPNLKYFNISINKKIESITLISSKIKKVYASSIRKLENLSLLSKINFTQRGLFIDKDIELEILELENNSNLSNLQDKFNKIQ